MVRGLCPTPAPNPPRQSSNARGVEDAAPYGGCETNVAAYNAAGAIPSRLTNGARAVPAELHTLGGGREAGAPWVTRVQSATPNSCNEPGPAVPRPRGVEDAAPYGRLRNERFRVEHNGHGQTYTLNIRTPHGSAETYPLAATVGGGVLDAPSAG